MVDLGVLTNMIMPIVICIFAVIYLLVWFPDFIKLLSGTKQYNTANADDRLTITVALFIVIAEGFMLLFKNMGILFNG